ncbi:polysaccharide deacetylase family protein [Sinomonas cyclohexanicum]|uniref:polysaccharide deacetylase family protein n=1 Tax=Sinomonas cyclohexanicum TaxID=322009 RepID=UPI001E56A0E3|nr:polysaccharide deacetylase family protein [Corynebacterium cyclohexanicum]
MTAPHPTRRAAIAALSAAAGSLLAGCADSSTPIAALPGGTPAPGDPSPSASATPSPARPTPTPVHFPSDYVIPAAQGGLAPVITRVATKQPVVFLTIDDGATKHPESLALLEEHGYPATLFLTKSAMGDNPGFFKGFAERGDHVQDHTISHDTTMSTKPYAYQLGEIKGMKDYIATTYGTAPTLFRPPGGAYSAAMRKAVADAGLKAIIDWEAKANAGSMQYQYGSSLRPGDIVLMHFRPEFAADLAAFRAAHLAAGLTVVRLEDFIGA